MSFDSLKSMLNGANVRLVKMETDFAEKEMALKLEVEGRAGKADVVLHNVHSFDLSGEIYSDFYEEVLFCKDKNGKVYFSLEPFDTKGHPHEFDGMVFIAGSAELRA